MLKDLIEGKGLIFLTCLGFGFALGIIQAILYTIKNRYSKSFIITLILLPSSVSLIIMLLLMINVDLGIALAVGGVFGLVRFRSLPGTGKEIISVLIAMVTGFAIGCGFYEYATVFSIISSIIILILNVTNIFEYNTKKVNKILRIMIPEDLNYTLVFEDVFNEYTLSHKQKSVKTTNMGSMFKITYTIVLKDANLEKKFIDELRCRNGNLEIMISDDVIEGEVL